MFLSHLKLTIRNFIYYPSYSLITLSGLVVGLTSTILIFMWVSFELGYGRNHPNHERVFALLANEQIEGEIVTQEGTAVSLADYFAHDVPEIESSTRVDNTRESLTAGAKSVVKMGVYADSGFFQVHPAQIIFGDGFNPFRDHHSILISEKLANLLFENGDALGKIISLDRKGDFKVAAVYASFPSNSGFDYFEFILPFDSKVRKPDDNWHNYDLKLYQASSREAVEQKINLKYKETFGNENTKAMLFCLTDWRLHWNFVNGKPSGGRIVYVLIFSVAALFILIMACINYMNIATARAAKRAREIGVRKMTGATQSVLIRQFISESLSMTFVATLISVLAVKLLLPLFKELTGTPLSFSIADPVLLSGLFIIVAFTGLLAGSYPALVLSSFKPATVLKGTLYTNIQGAGFRKVLVVFQFTLSVVMIFSAIVMWQQTNFLLKKDLGYDKQQVINIWLEGDIDYPLDNLKTEMLAHTSIVSAAFGGASPMEVNGFAEANSVTSPFPKPVMIYGANIDQDMLSTLKFTFIKGRNFSREMASDSNCFVITQKAAEALGLKNPVGQMISYNMFGDQKGEIIGVIKDFHHDDIHRPINPVIFTLGKPMELRNMFVRYEENKLDVALIHVKQVFQKFQPGTPVNYSLLDRDFEDQFYKEKFLANLSIWVASIAIVIACLGLFGLTMFNAQRRTKEIGIRKVLGASVEQVVVMLCRDFVGPVMTSFLLAFPIAYYLMDWFLEGYVFHTTMHPSSFVWVVLMMAGLVLVTVSYQSFKAAVRNPVESLKVE